MQSNLSKTYIFGTVIKFPYYRDTRLIESTRGSKKKGGPTLGVRFSKVSVKRDLTIIVKKTDTFPSLKQLQPYYITQQNMTYTYLCDEDMLPNLQYPQTGHSSNSLRDFSQLIISQYTTLYKEKKMYQSKAFDLTREGWLILIVKLAISISFVGKLKQKACDSCFFGTPLVFSKISTCIFISIHHVIKIMITIPIMIINMIKVMIMIMITITITIKTKIMIVITITIL